MKIAVFLDYDNLLEAHKTSGVLDIVSKILLRAPLPSGDNRGTCDIRIYGGWYEGPTMTPLAQSIAVAIGADFPYLIRIPRVADEQLNLILTAELAYALIEEPAHHLINTYRRKSRPRNVRVLRPIDIGCVESACPLPKIKSLLKTGECPVSSCAVANLDLVYRHEQKLVDTMLTCDLVYSAHLNYDSVIIVSGDDDFLPPVRTLLLRGNRVVRCNPQPASFSNPFSGFGSHFTDISI